MKLHQESSTKTLTLVLSRRGGSLKPVNAGRS